MVVDNRLTVEHDSAGTDCTAVDILLVEVEEEAAAEWNNASVQNKSLAAAADSAGALLVPSTLLSAPENFLLEGPGCCHGNSREVSTTPW